MTTTTIHVGDALDVLRTMPDESVHCIVTSPPYWGLRDYGVEGQLGLEPTLDEYLAAMIAVGDELRRVLRSDGTCWLNLGDAYQSDKQLVGLPWRVAFAWQAAGWWLRQGIVWAKPNPMPESVRDRCTNAHEYVFLLTKAARYHYDADAIAEPATRANEQLGIVQGSKRRAEAMGRKPSGNEVPGAYAIIGETRNVRSVWTIASQPFSDAHFATMPPALAERCIRAGASTHGCCADCGAPFAAVYMPNGARSNMWEPRCSCISGDPMPCTVLDPFGGAGTTALAAARLGLSSVLIELSPTYAEMAASRLRREIGTLYHTVTVEAEYSSAQCSAEGGEA